MKRTKDRPQITARQWLEEYKSDRDQYTRKWKKLFGNDMPKIRKSGWGVIKRGSKNLTRIPADVLRLWRTNFKSQKTEHLVAELVVESRRVVIKDARRGLVDGVNVKTYRALAVEGVVTEVNCRNIIRVRGLNLGQFYSILWRLGANIRPFFSEDKGENGGRWVMDNHNLSEFFPGGINEDKDMYFLQKIFPKAPRWMFGGRWTNSRTHGVIFEVKTKTGETELLIPVHIDAENAFVAIKEMVLGKKHREVSAIEYHRMPEQQGNIYVGSGLSETGCLVLIGLMQKAKQKGIIKHVKVRGRKRLATSGYISDDELLMWEITNLVRQEREGKMNT